MTSYFLVIGKRIFLIFSIFFVFSSYAFGKSLKVITYNVWHGLSPQGYYIKSKELEFKERKSQRVEMHIKAFKEQNADILFLQEVNPITPFFGKSLAKKYAKALGMDVVTQQDNCGIKIFNLGLPYNLNTGLVILAKKSLNLGKLLSKKLSGSMGGCFSIFSFQLSEFRYALFAEVEIDNKKTLIVNTHLHHGSSMAVLGPTFKRLLLNGVLRQTAYEDIARQVKRGEKRRYSEAWRLLKTLETVKYKRGYENVILSGDFNASPRSDTIQLVKNSGFVSLGAHKTWVPRKNKNISDFSEDFDPPYSFPIRSRLSTEDLLEKKGEPKDVFYYTKKEVEALRSVFYREQLLPIKLDYIFVSKSIAQRAMKTQLFGHQEQNGLHGSDHFGVVSQLNL